MTIGTEHRGAYWDGALGRAAAGIPTVAFGPGSIRLAHADDESCSIEEIVCASRAYALAVIAWCGH